MEETVAKPESAPATDLQPNHANRICRQAKREEARREAEKAAQRKRQMTIIAAIAGVAVIAVLALILINRDDDDSGSTAPPIVAAPAPRTVPMDGLSLGNPDASVVIVEYGDYQCPACGNFAENGFDPLVEEFVASGDVLFTYVPDVIPRR